MTTCTSIYNVRKCDLFIFLEIATMDGGLEVSFPAKGYEPQLSHLGLVKMVWKKLFDIIL